MTSLLELGPSANSKEDPWIKKIAAQVRNEGMDPAEAVDEITKKGDHLFIGTAVTSRLHRPMPAMVARHDREQPYWAYRLPNEQGDGTRPISRAGSIANTAIHAARGGDVNIVQQRLITDNLLVPEVEFYHGGTYGWKYNKDTEAYGLKEHERYQAGTTHIPDDQDIGNLDAVLREGYDIEIPDEPGHFGSYDVHERVGTIVITMGHTRRNIARSAIQYINYPPLNIPS